MNLIPNIDVAVDINSLAPVFIDHILNVNDTNSRTFSFTLYANNQKISLYSGNFTAKAAISVNNILLDDNVTALIQTDSTVAVTVDNKYLTLIPGVMKIQLTITGGTDVIVTPLPILARVTSDLAQTAQILPDSHSSYSEIVAEIVAARGDFDNLSEAIASKVTFVETTDPDTATENGTWYKVHTNTNGDYALFAISTSAQQAQFRIRSTGTIGIRRRYLSSGGIFPEWGSFEQIGWKGSEIDGMIATYLANVKTQTITAQSTHDQIPTAKAVYDYAASKASYTYLNNQYTQLANDVAQLPTTAEVQQMIDDSTGAAINSISLDKSSQSITLPTGSIINEQSLITGLSIPYGTKIYVKLGFSANDNPIISGKAVQIRANEKFIVSLNRGAANTWTEVTLSGQLTSGEIITRLGVYLANDVLSTQTDFILSVRSSIIKSINDKESTANKVTSISANSTDAQYPSAAAVYTAIQTAIQNEIGGVINGQY